MVTATTTTKQRDTVFFLQGPIFLLMDERTLPSGISQDFPWPYYTIPGLSPLFTDSKFV